MTQLCPRSTFKCLALSLLLSGCATQKNEVAPSLMGQLQGQDNGIHQASYHVEAESDLDFNGKVEDPITLKLHYARWVEEMENYPEARRHYAAVLEQRPENFDAILGLARIDQASGDVASAENGFRRAISLQPNSHIAQHAMGQCMLKQGHVAESLPLLNQAVSGQPANKAYRYHLAEALAKSGDVNAAMPHFEQTVGKAAAHFNVATVLKQRGDLRGAEQHYRQALTVNPQLKQAQYALHALQQARQAQHLANSPQQGGATQGRPNNGQAPTVVPAAHHMSTPLNSLTPAQRQQLRNQRQLTR